MLNKTNVRSVEQMKRMEKAEKERLCPFCGEGLKIIHQKPILFKTKNFLFTESAFPYEGTKHHFLILSKKHITDIGKLTGSAWGEIGGIIKKVNKKYKIEGGVFFVRFGDIKKTGSSIDHLHFHLLEGTASERDVEKERDSIKVKLGYKKK